MRKQYRYKATTMKGGHVMIRDYNLNECNNTGCDLVMVYRDREMLIPHEQLKLRAIKLDDRTQPSQFGKPYKNYHIRWQPTDGEEIKDKQKELFTNDKNDGK